jgi:D-3-phosphoglycerate dehydrogenase / 2-oxoglutarate reductase
MFKIASINKISSKGMNLFGSKYEFVQDADQANGILVRSQEMSDMKFSDELYAIARAGAGTNNIPVQECSKNGIVVFNTPGANANAVKELVLAGLFLSSRDIVSGVNWAKSIPLDVEKTVEKGKSKFSGNEIWGKTLGVIGLGAIGVLVANAAADLHMKVIGYDPYLSVNAALDLSNKITLSENLSEMLVQCDYIAIHVPFSDSTKELINEELLNVVKTGVNILNFSRDKIVDEEALIKALYSGKVHRYVTDFPNERVKDLDNVICIPHLGASTSESEENCAVMAVEELMDYLENGNIFNSVNFPNCSMGVCQTAGRIAVLHKNIPKMIGLITNLMAEMNINISDMTNRSKGEYQYTLIDVDSHISSNDIETLKGVSGIISARIIK